MNEWTQMITNMYTTHNTDLYLCFHLNDTSRIVIHPNIHVYTLKAQVLISVCTLPLIYRKSIELKWDFFYH